MKQLLVVILYVGSPAALVFTVLQWVHQLLKLLMWELEYISPQVPVLDPDLLNIYNLYHIVVKFVIIQRGPKVSTHTLGLKPPPCFIFEGTYLFEDSVTKIWKFDFLGPHPINIGVLILVFVNILETPL